MFKKILIANRGEIAMRIIRACKELNIETVAIYSEKDADSLHVRFSDEAICIGPAPSNESYLNIPRIISAAEVTNADAIHPGYGFLAENAQFADICESCDIVFIGPTAETIENLGDKSYAKKSMKEAGVPVVPGSEDVLQDEESALKSANEIGYPVMIKASAGGGGKGMRIVKDAESMENAFAMASAEADAAFGDSRLYMEKLIIDPRHVEIQVMADNYGNVVHFGERDCSVQRRHQKLIEESPSPAVDEELRNKIGETAVKGVSSVNYRNAGTVEFLLDSSGDFYFMEVNTRIQVEHPVTEMVTGVDLIKMQIQVAAGEALDSLITEEIHLDGHAIECRINAEDPDRDFLPNPGIITSLNIPGGPGTRVDSHIYANYPIPPYYDSMLAKIIAHGKDRSEAVERMKRALDEFVVEGIKTTIPFHQKVLNTKDFVEGNIDTGFLERLNDNV